MAFKAFISATCKAPAVFPVLPELLSGASSLKKSEDGTPSVFGVKPRLSIVEAEACSS